MLLLRLFVGARAAVQGDSGILVADHIPVIRVAVTLRLGLLLDVS